MRKALLALASLLAALAVPAHAREPAVTAETGSTRFVPARVVAERQAIARYGPFRVLDSGRAALVGVTDSATPTQFAAMLRDHPALTMLELVECPGTEDDRANLELGRLIRAAGFVTRVPRGGSVRSGAVELFLAGTARHIEEAPSLRFTRGSTRMDARLRISRRAPRSISPILPITAKWAWTRRRRGRSMR